MEEGEEGIDPSSLLKKVNFRKMWFFNIKMDFLQVVQFGCIWSISELWARFMVQIVSKVL